MMNPTNLGIEIVRGDRPISDVTRLGVSVCVTPLFFELDEPPGVDMILPTVEDVATGFLVHLGHESVLREWATLVLGAEFIDLALVEGDPDGEAMMEGMWQASTGEPLSPGALRAVAAALARRRPY
jgi:hypothetical protein